MCTRLRLLVEQPTTQELLDAASITEPISFADKVCLVVAKKRAWTCVTNDAKLRACCRKYDVDNRRGLGLLIDLVRAGAMTNERAMAIAEVVSTINPGHIGVSVLTMFKKKLEGKS